jgi:hypothetical protein
MASSSEHGNGHSGYIKRPGVCYLRDYQLLSCITTDRRKLNRTRFGGVSSSGITFISYFVKIDHFRK